MSLGVQSRVDWENLNDAQSLFDRLWDLLIVQRPMSDRHVPHQTLRLCFEMLFTGLLEFNVQETGKPDDTGVFARCALI